MTASVTLTVGKHHPPQLLGKRHAAAFYDLEGTLCSTNIVHTYGFFAKNQPTFLKSAIKTVSTVASIPFFVAADAYSRKIFNELFYRRYRGEPVVDFKCGWCGCVCVCVHRVCVSTSIHVLMCSAWAWRPMPVT